MLNLLTLILLEDYSLNTQNFEEDKPIGFLERKKFKKHRKRPIEKTYSCDICSKVFAKKVSVSTFEITHKTILVINVGKDCQLNKKHKETHSDIKSYSCDFCNKVFSIITLLANQENCSR